MSGVPQGSVSEPLLFLIYISDLDDNIISNVLKFADDTKVFRRVNNDGDKQHLQNGLDKLPGIGLRNGRCSILRNVNACIQDSGTWM